jgi:hypothetical protein
VTVADTVALLGGAALLLTALGGIGVPLILRGWESRDKRRAEQVTLAAAPAAKLEVEQGQPVTVTSTPADDRLHAELDRQRDYWQRRAERLERRLDAANVALARLDKPPH